MRKTSINPDRPLLEQIEPGPCDDRLPIVTREVARRLDILEAANQEVERRLSRLGNELQILEHYLRLRPISRSERMQRTLDITDMEGAKKSGVEAKGDPGMWICIAKAWDTKGKWMKSTKVLEVPRSGCFLQVTTQEGSHVAEAVTWAPGTKLNAEKTGLVPL